MSIYPSLFQFPKEALCGPNGQGVGPITGRFEPGEVFLSELSCVPTSPELGWVEVEGFL